MAWQPFTRNEVQVRVHAAPETLPVEGNASASGSDAFDREVEHNILCRIQQGDVWAWAAVTVTVSWGPFSGEDHLGCCSYADEDEFRQPGGYFDDMAAAALEELNQTAQDAYRQLKHRDVAA